MSYELREGLRGSLNKEAADLSKLISKVIKPDMVDDAALYASQAAAARNMLPGTNLRMWVPRTAPKGVNINPQWMNEPGIIARQGVGWKNPLHDLYASEIPWAGSIGNISSLL